MSTVVAFFYSPLCETRDCVRRFESRLTTYKMLALNSSRSKFFVADMVIPFGRYGLFVWPMWSWPIWFVADIVVADRLWSVADMVQTHVIDIEKVKLVKRTV